jgi:ankyrin repeat protein
MLADYSSLDTMKLLVNNGADVNVQNVNGSTTLMLVAGTYENYVDVLSLLLDNGADVTIKDNNGKTAIDYAKDAGTAIIGTPPDKSEIMRLLQQQ